MAMNGPMYGMKPPNRVISASGTTSGTPRTQRNAA